MHPLFPAPTMEGYPTSSVWYFLYTYSWIPCTSISDMPGFMAFITSIWAWHETNTALRSSFNSSWVFMERRWAIMGPRSWVFRLFFWGSGASDSDGLLG